MEGFGNWTLNRNARLISRCWGAGWASVGDTVFGTCGQPTPFPWGAEVMWESGRQRIGSQTIWV